MNIVKDNLIIVIFSVLSALSFVILLVYRSSITTEIKEKEAKIQRAAKLQEDYHGDLAEFKNLNNDFSQAKSELNQLAALEKKQTLFWKKILNPRENHMIKWKNKAAESVNADITRLFSSLRARCRAKEIELPSAANKTPAINFGSTSNKPENNFGFGFSSYDGFWPSFNPEEANIIGVQAKIIKEIVEILTQSVTESESLSLVEILREYAGEVDLKYIKNDQLILGTEQQLLLRTKGKIDSLVFKVSIKGQSMHARTFINQLRPPFMLRNISVRRDILIEEPPQEDLNFIPNPFGNSGDQTPIPKSKSSPIVKDVNSEFIFLIEYVTKVSNNFAILFENKSIWENAEEDYLVEFLTNSGNSDIIEDAKSKIFSSEQN
jgi:hypothetical protein